MPPGHCGDEENPVCPVAATMDLLNGKWTLHVLRELMQGKRRFNEISRALGPCSSRTLCCRLRSLEEEGIVVRQIKHTIPPWVEYDLTEKGQALAGVIKVIAEWSLKYMTNGGASRSKVVCEEEEESSDGAC